jgi:hypothetical protein
LGGQNTDMKIAEIVNFVADQEPEAARARSFMQSIANTFTPSGLVKHPLEFQRLGSGSIAPSDQAAPIAASDDATSIALNADGVADAGTTIARQPIDMNVEPRSALAHPSGSIRPMRPNAVRV